MKFILSLMAALICAGCATGSHTLIGQARPALAPASVKIYAAAPQGSEVVAILTARGYTGGQAGNGYAVDELRTHAAKVGANGIVLTSSSVEPLSGWTGHSTVLTAQAIYVNSQSPE